jgi:hypothetical protein
VVQVLALATKLGWFDILVVAVVAVIVVVLLHWRGRV